MLTAQEALIRLQEGNQRFVEGKSTYNTNYTQRRNELVDGQTPFAITVAQIQEFPLRLCSIKDLGIYL